MKRGRPSSSLQAKTARQGREVHELKVQLLRKARERARHAGQRFEPYRDLHLRRRALGIVAAVAEYAVVHALLAQALEQRLRDISAIVDHVGLSTAPTTRALQKERSSRSRSSGCTAARRRVTTSAPPANAAGSCRSGPRAAGAVFTSTTL